MSATQFAVQPAPECIHRIRGSAVVERLTLPLYARRGRPHRDLLEQRLLVLVVIVDQRLADPRGGGYILKAQLRGTERRKSGRGRVKDAIRGIPAWPSRVGADPRRGGRCRW